MDAWKSVRYSLIWMRKVKGGCMEERSLTKRLTKKDEKIKEKQSFETDLH